VLAERVPFPKDAEMTASSGDEIGDLADNVSRRAGKEFRRAQDVAAHALDDAHEASVRNPHISLAIALGLGFLFGVLARGRG
jgi:ElaB/YqjD/DUF883 family membrane-anchored ribosome-binding protein